MSKTTLMHESDALKILDNNGMVRTNLLKKYLPSTIDAIRYYHFTGKLARLPVAGRFIKKALYLYYRYLHTNSLVYPLKDMEKAIETATDIYVDPCPCRAIAEDEACDAPLYTCMRINHTATIRKEMKDSKGLSKKDALGIIRNAYNKGLVLSLESCVQPYQNNICMCCNCCCIAMKMRYDYGVGIYNSGPYLPEADLEKCINCESCVEKCPVSAVNFKDDKLKVDTDKCLGCGQCAANCQTDAITMVFHQSRVRADKEPGRIKLFLYMIYIHAVMIPSVILYRLIYGSKQSVMDSAKPNENDYFNKSMQN